MLLMFLKRNNDELKADRPTLEENYNSFTFVGIEDSDNSTIGNDLEILFPEECCLKDKQDCFSKEMGEP